MSSGSWELRVPVKETKPPRPASSVTSTSFGSGASSGSPRESRSVIPSVSSPGRYSSGRVAR